MGITMAKIEKINMKVERDRGDTKISQALHEQRAYYEVIQMLKRDSEGFKEEIEHIEKLEGLLDVIGYKTKHDLPLGMELIDLNDNVEALTNKTLKY